MKRILTSFLILATFSFSCTFAFENSNKSKKEKNPDVFPEKMSDTKGYLGTLPSLEEHFKPFQVEESKPLFEYQDGFNDPDSIKPIPRDNPAFINIIMKKDKSSQYLNDLNEIIDILEKLETLIEQKANVQVYNAKAFFLDKHVEYFRDKYKDRAESSFISFKELMELNTQVQAIAQLRQEGEIYSPYITNQSSGNAFSNANINNQLDYLLINLKRTIITLKEVR